MGLFKHKKRRFFKNKKDKSVVQQTANTKKGEGPDQQLGGMTYNPSFFISEDPIKSEKSEITNQAMGMMMSPELISEVQSREIKVQRCTNGHFFDGAKFKSCPFCDKFGDEEDEFLHFFNDENEQTDDIIKDKAPPLELGQMALPENFISEDPISSANLSKGRFS